MGADATSCCAETIVDLPGFVVLAAGEYGGELELLVETTATEVDCSQCGTGAVVHDRREHLLRDVPVAGRATVLVWWKRIWRCPNPACAMRTWTERSPLARPRQSLTGVPAPAEPADTDGPAATIRPSAMMMPPCWSRPAAGSTRRALTKARLVASPRIWGAIIGCRRPAGCGPAHRAPPCAPPRPSRPARGSPTGRRRQRRSRSRRRGSSALGA